MFELGDKDITQIAPHGGARYIGLQVVDQALEYFGSEVAQWQTSLHGTIRGSRNRLLHVCQLRSCSREKDIECYLDRFCRNRINPCLDFTTRDPSVLPVWSDADGRLGNTALRYGLWKQFFG